MTPSAWSASLAAGGLSIVRVPSEPEEALRDLVRAREDVREDLMRARHRLSKMLLRRGLRYEAGSNQSDRHIDWIVRLKFDDLASRMVVGEYVTAVQQLNQRRKDLEATIEQRLPSAPFDFELPVTCNGSSEASRMRVTVAGTR